MNYEAQLLARGFGSNPVTIRSNNAKRVARGIGTILQLASKAISRRKRLVRSPIDGRAIVSICHMCSERSRKIQKVDPTSRRKESPPSIGCKAMEGAVIDASHESARRCYCLINGGSNRWR